MADDAADYSGTSDSDSGSDKAPSSSGIVHFFLRMSLASVSVLHASAGCGCAPMRTIAGEDVDRRLWRPRDHASAIIRTQQALSAAGASL